MVVEALWRITEGLLFGSWIPGSGWRVAMLRMFGAQIGRGVMIKPKVRVKFPWKLHVGDHSWLGEGLWIDNLAEVSIGDHCCLSQGAYLGTGNHRWDRDSFDLKTSPIRLENHCWIGAMALVAPGAVCGEGVVLTMGSMAKGELAKWQVYSGSPATIIKPRSPLTAGTQPGAND